MTARPNNRLRNKSNFQVPDIPFSIFTRERRSIIQWGITRFFYDRSNVIRNSNISNSFFRASTSSTKYLYTRVTSRRFFTSPCNFGGLYTPMKASDQGTRLTRGLRRTLTSNLSVVLLNHFMVRLRVTFPRRFVRCNRNRMKVSNANAVSRRRNDIRRLTGLTAFCGRYNLRTFLGKSRIVVSDTGYR